MAHSRLHWKEPVLLVMLGAACACAQAQDVVTWRGSLGVSQDDNFLRGPDSAKVSEEITTMGVGVHVAIPYSLQRFELDVGLTNNQHKKFSSFDYVGQNYSASWIWSYTPQLHGTLSTTRAETLNAPSDAVNPGLRNRNVSTNTALNAEYELGSGLRLLGGATNSESVNEQALVGQADNRSNAYNAGLRYSASSGNFVGYSLQRGIGSSTSGYVQTTHSLDSSWQAAGSTSITARLAHNEQHFGNTPEFSYSGLSGALNVNWALTGKTSLTAGWQRDLASFQTVGSTHTQTDSVSVAPLWNISAKTSLGLQYRQSTRSNQGSPTGVAVQRQDQLRDTSLTYSWQPRPFASITASLTHSDRTSDNAGLDYTARLASLSAQLSF